MSIFNHFQNLSLTNDQTKALKLVNDFLVGEDDVFILQGYAGSGKTTLLKGIVQYLNSIERKCQLMAPTGRAAKVIRQKSGFEATTVHKGIYSFDSLNDIDSEDSDSDLSFMYYYKLRNNFDLCNSVLIVDEASMLSDKSSEGAFFRFGSGYLLKDLFQYAQIGFANANNKIIFVGDPAQLPPIGMNFSPALDKSYLVDNYNLKVDVVELKEVKRQDINNGILYSATNIRKCLTSGFFNNFDLKENGKDIFNPKFENFLDNYKSQNGSKVIITYKNKTAFDLNRFIRNDKFGGDLIIQPSDVVIVGGNNYRLGIMNGEFGVIASAEPICITREVRFNQKGGGVVSVLLSWRLVDLMIPDENGASKSINGYILENFLNGDNNLTITEQQALYVDFRNRHQGLRPKTEMFKDAILKDPFFNCILLKYGYAVTCHKAQGGEWDATFVFWDKNENESFDLNNAVHTLTGKNNAEFYRWAYTAVTRASRILNCINPPYFHSFSKMMFLDNNVINSYQVLTGQTLQVVEIELDNVLVGLLEKFNLQDASIVIQNHFLNLHYHSQKQGIEIVKYQRVSYEIKCVFNRENEYAAFKFWVNGKDELSKKYMNFPTETTSMGLFSDIEMIINENSCIVVNRNTTKEEQVEFDFQLEEEKPFLKLLFNLLRNEIEILHVEILDIQHYNYRERYTFLRKNEKATIDFEYDGQGFFGRVFAVENKCNSLELVNEIKSVTQKIKNL